MKLDFFESNTYFIDEEVSLFKFENCYQIYDGKGENIGLIKQEPMAGQRILALFLGRNTLPFILEIRNSNNDLEVTISRGWTFFMSEITIKNAQGVIIGVINQRFNLFNPTFEIFNSSGILIAEITGDWAAWNFEIYGPSNNQIGTISKKYGGLLKEMFTSIDKYNVNIDANYPYMENKVIILAGAITIDMVLRR